MEVTVTASKPKKGAGAPAAAGGDAFDTQWGQDYDDGSDDGGHAHQDTSAAAAAGSDDMWVQQGSQHAHEHKPSATAVRLSIGVTDSGPSAAAGQSGLTAAQAKRAASAGDQAASTGSSGNTPATLKGGNGLLAPPSPAGVSVALL